MLAEAMETLRDRWRAADLLAQFALAAAAVIGLGVAVLSWWVSGRIERGVVAHAAANSALQLDYVFEPHLQEMAQSGQLSKRAQDEITALVAHRRAGHGIAAVTVWNRDSKVVFTTREAGTPVPLKELRRAWSGNVESSFEPSGFGGPDSSAGTAGPALHIFAPMHADDEKTVAVIEVVEAADGLAGEVRRTKLQTAGIAGLLSLAMIGSLLGIVRRGSQTITHQKTDLLSRVGELSQLLDQNEELQQRVAEANRRSNDTNDRALRRIGAELHDGPVQLIALGLLRLESLKHASSRADHEAALAEIASIEGALRDALKEVRDLCSGLALPKLDGVSVRKALEFAVMNHERRSRTRVKTDYAPDLPLRAPLLLLTFLYRFAQEGLNNAVRHAGGNGQAVSARVEGAQLVVEVCDEGPGFTETLDNKEQGGLGLAGLRDRVESFGGTLEIEPRDGGGTRLIAYVDLSAIVAPDISRLG